MSDQGKAHNLTVQDIKSLSDKLLQFLGKEAQTSNPYILDMIIDQAKSDIANTHFLGFDLDSTNLLNCFNLKARR
jgi:hypothetical protein